MDAKEFEPVLIAAHQRSVILHGEILVKLGELKAIHDLGIEYNSRGKNPSNRVAEVFHKLAKAFCEKSVQAHLQDLEKLTKK